jgi:hypothetical protein
MRGKQVRVYLHPADHTDVDAFVHGDLASTLLAERSSVAEPAVLADSTGPGMGALICPASMLPVLTPRHIPSRNEWVLEVEREPLVEWWYSAFENGALFPGRFYYVPTGADNKQKPTDFLSSAEHLFRWVRRSTESVNTEWGRERLGRRAAEKFRRGEVVLRRNPPGLRP